MLQPMRMRIGFPEVITPLIVAVPALRYSRDHAKSAPNVRGEPESPRVLIRGAIKPLIISNGYVLTDSAAGCIFGVCGSARHHRSVVDKVYPPGYTGGVIRVHKTDVFAHWLDGLRDLKARARVQVRIERLPSGNPGDVASVGEGVSEMRIDVGPGYRVYFKQRGTALIILLAGGDKSTQARDIKTALKLARNLEE